MDISVWGTIDEKTYPKKIRGVFSPLSPPWIPLWVLNQFTNEVKINVLLQKKKKIKLTIFLKTIILFQIHFRFAQEILWCENTETASYLHVGFCKSHTVGQHIMISTRLINGSGVIRDNEGNAISQILLRGRVVPLLFGIIPKYWQFYVFKYNKILNTQNTQRHVLMLAKHVWRMTPTFNRRLDWNTYVIISRLLVHLYALRTAYKLQD